MLSDFYKLFRATGLTAHQAYAAAYAAVRVAVFHQSEVPNWTHLFRGMNPDRTACVRLAIAHTQPLR